MIECFTDGLDNNNKARRECGLDNVPQAHHNLYVDKKVCFPALEKLFAIQDLSTLGQGVGKKLEGYNFLSSHYFISRVLYPGIARDKWVRNSEFSKFFAAWIPPAGNYSPLQAFVFRKK